MSRTSNFSVERSAWGEAPSLTFSAAHFPSASFHSPSSRIQKLKTTLVLCRSMFEVRRWTSDVQALLAPQSTRFKVLPGSVSGFSFALSPANHPDTLKISKNKYCISQHFG